MGTSPIVMNPNQNYVANSPDKEDNYSIQKGGNYLLDMKDNGSVGDNLFLEISDTSFLAGPVNATVNTDANDTIRLQANWKLASDKDGVRTYTDPSGRSTIAVSGEGKVAIQPEE